MNTKSAKELVNLYRWIDVDRIRKNESRVHCRFYGVPILKRLVGFGDKSKCLLCKSAKYNCSECIYILQWSNVNSLMIGSCMLGDAFETYSAIVRAKNASDLLAAINLRADYIDSLINIDDDGWF